MDWGQAGSMGGIAGAEGVCGGDSPGASRVCGEIGRAGGVHRGDLGADKVHQGG